MQREKEVLIVITCIILRKPVGVPNSVICQQLGKRNLDVVILSLDNNGTSIE